MTSNKFRFSIDRGGTFTDVYGELPNNQGYRIVKLLSEDPSNYEDAPREGIRRILEEVTGNTFNENGFSGKLIESIKMGTTVATNALLERKGTDTLLVTTKGFRDILAIGNQSRPKIFDLIINKPSQLYKAVVEIDERVYLARENKSPKKIISGVSGESLYIEKTINKTEVYSQLKRFYDVGMRSIAIVFIHGYTFHDHEKIVGAIAKEIGFTNISLSHEVMPMVKLVPRGDTTTVDAYLTPHIHQYLESFRSGFTDGLESTSVLFMQSDGGLVNADNFKGSNAILSGPAGGVAGYAFNSNTDKPLIGFDMGGTSTDVSRFHKEYSFVHETEIAGTRIQAPQLDIKTVAAGGGSRLFFRNGMFEVGPESAGSDPGPLCYRKDGYLTVTDANLFLGRINPDYFPKIFGKDEDLPLDVDVTKKAFRELTKEINQYYESEGRSPLTPEETAEGFINIANETMARPIREISIMRGYDSAHHVLAPFGGAGGQHACAIARTLGISDIRLHRFAGILSAYGIASAEIVAEKQEPSAFTYSEKNLITLVLPRLKEISQNLIRQFIEKGYEKANIQTKSYLHLRYDGTDTAMMIQQTSEKDFKDSFQEIYKKEFGFSYSDKKIIIDDIRVRVSIKSPKVYNSNLQNKQNDGNADSFTSTYYNGVWYNTPVYLIEDLNVDQKVDGPALIMQQTSTIFIEPQCSGLHTSQGDIHISLSSQKQKTLRTTIDPIQLSLFSNLFMSVAEQMGRTLEKTAISTNIKERLDFSCALFDPTGGLVANAPHLPVHLGAMSDTVRMQIKLQGDNLKEGDVLVTNDPTAGGSHLPDITVITPVWKDGNIIFFTASRGHHADIGGISPGSMPPFSKKLEEEGVCIKSFTLVENGVFNEKGITKILQNSNSTISGSRRISDNIADLKAQVAANQKGVTLILDIVENYSLDVVQAYMKHIQNNAEKAVRSMFQELSTKWNLKSIDSIRAKDFLDDGSKIALAITIDRKNGSALFDFSGTSPELTGNLNTPRSVVSSAILYSLRCLIDKEIPLNQGCLNPITIKIEDNSLLSPSPTAAIVGGNVLTSQRITDVILKAFKASAASQGCMNNLTFGDSTFGYYETIGGGAGAGPTWHGQSGVHTHMTNTRITDPEILERRYPVVLREFSIRQNSGGTGLYNGGNGLIREIEFLSPLNVAILSERRNNSPYGLLGGKDGAKGENYHIKSNGDVINLGGKNEINTHPNDRIRILTPGGGAYGKAEKI